MKTMRELAKETEQQFIKACENAFVYGKAMIEVKWNPDKGIETRVLEYFPRMEDKEESK